LSVGLSENQKAQLKTLSESIDSNLSVDEFKGKLQILKEHNFKAPAPKTGGSIVPDGSKTQEQLNEELKAQVPAVDPSVSRYVDAISRTVPKN